MKLNASLILLLAGLLVVYFGFYFEVVPIISLTVIGMGLFGIFHGVQLIIAAHAHVPASSAMDSPTERRAGLTTQLWGALFVAFGLLIIAFGVGYWISPESPEEWWDKFLSRPSGWGLLLLTAGPLVTIRSLTQLFAPRSAFTGASLQNFFERYVSGGFLLLVGVGMVVLGLFLIIAPALLGF